MDSTNDTILMEHNIKVYEKAKEYIEKHGKVAVVQPTGTGKSYIAMQIMQDMQNCKKLVIAPSRNFLDFMQTNEYWDNNAVTFTYSYLARNSEFIEYKVMELLGSLDNIELIVIDEFHRAGAPEWGKAVRKIVDCCKNAKLLGLSATPIRSDSNRNMVDELFNGYSVGNISLSDAVTEKILPKLHYVLGVASANNEVNRMIKANDENKYFLSKITAQLVELKHKWNTTNTFKNTLRKYLIPADCVGYTEGLESRHIVFLTRIKDLEQYTETIQQWFSEIYTGYTIDIGFVHSGMTKKQNSKVLEQFSSTIAKNTIKVIVTVQMMNESFHFDSVKSVSMFRYTEATNIFIQQIGRALSAKSKSPYIFDFVENFSSVGYTAFSVGSNKIQEIEIESLFESFNDETKSCLDEIESLQKKLNSRVYFYTQLLPNLVKQHGTLYDIPDTELKEWAVRRFKRLQAKKSDITDKECFDMTKLIAESTGEEWYTNYKNYHSLTSEEAKEFENKTKLLFECNCLSFKIQQQITENTGIEFSRLVMSINYYAEIVIKSKHQECKQVARLVKALEEGNKYNCIRYMKACENIYRFTAESKPIFSINTLDKAYAHKIWEIVSSDKANEALLNYEFTPEQQIIQRAFRGYSRYTMQSLTFEDFITLNNGILSRELEDNDIITREILKYFSISTKKRLISVVDSLVKFTETIESFKRKHELLLNGTMTNRIAIITLQEDLEKFVNRYKHASLCEYFREAYDKFEIETLANLKNTIKHFNLSNKTNRYSMIESKIYV